MDQRKLATLVAKQSHDVSVKFGHTNGRPVLHLKNSALRKSVTIASAVEWEQHEWNHANRPKRRDRNSDVLEAIRNEDAK